MGFEKNLQFFSRKWGNLGVEMAPFLDEIDRLLGEIKTMLADTEAPLIEEKPVIEFVKVADAIKRLDRKIEKRRRKLDRLENNYLKSFVRHIHWIGFLKRFKSKIGLDLTPET
jgi:hypothetical protein